MGDPTRRLTAILTLFLFASSLCFGKGPEKRSYDKHKQRDAPMPQEVLSAKTIAIIARVIGAPASPVRAANQKSIVCD